VDDLATFRPYERTTRLPTMGGYLALIWSNIVVIVIATMFGATLGAVAASRVPPAFKASVAVELPDVPTFVDMSPADPIADRVTIDTTAALVNSQPVARRVVQQTNLTFRQVQNGLSVSAYPLSRVIIVSFTAPRADLADTGAAAAAASLGIERQNTLPGTKTGPLTGLLDDLNELHDEMVANGTEFTETARSIQDLIIHLQQVKRQTGGAEGADVAVVAAKRVNQHPELQVLTGLVLGMFAGFIYAWWQPVRSYRRRASTSGSTRAAKLATLVETRASSSRGSTPSPRGTAS
jgi:hypothetical protein